MSGDQAGLCEFRERRLQHEFNSVTCPETWFMGLDENVGWEYCLSTYPLTYPLTHPSMSLPPLAKYDVFHIRLTIPGETDGHSASSDRVQHYIAIAQSEEQAIALLKANTDTYAGLRYEVKSANVVRRGPDESVYAPAEQLYRI